MKAMAIRKYGKTSPLVEMEFPMPTMNDEDVLIEIHAASVNPIDFKNRNGLLRILFDCPMPFILGNDCAGIVTKVGSKVTDFKLKEGQKVLIHAGAGGLGTFAIQLAKSMGLYVATTASEKGYDLVKAMGADEIINYKTEAFEKKLHDYDAVIDALGGDDLIKSFKVVKKGGKVLSVSGVPNGRIATRFGLGILPMVVLTLASSYITATSYYYGVDYEFLFMQADGQELRHITDLIEQGKIKPVIDRTYSLSEGQQALDYVESGRAKGKVVIQVRE
ncbi:hypothetical protein MCAP1_000612 [Malassezia caprae]|uniref:Enoyl reductase (ER) domain-containing protein n=1 Tax=Malassezia caprae TaxID=1381934 RepID=A0AAF0E3U9_9BASI|nr:hypothetical protein MCAP1_000612 [Malassezia caprae]